LGRDRRAACDDFCSSRRHHDGRQTLRTAVLIADEQNPAPDLHRVTIAGAGLYREE
jgi:hypothetical protein